MKLRLLGAALAIALVSGLAGAAVAAALPKTYQVTGPVLAVTSDMITVQKGTDKWEIAKDASTKTTGTPAVGSTVTIQYRMTAATIDVKTKK